MGARVTLLLLAVLTVVGCGGGQRLVMVITSSPSDALVYVNDYPRGVTPVEVPYIYIGTYRVQLRHEGYQDIDALEQIGKPWYNWIPFASLLLDSLPLPIRHEVRLHYEMVALPPEEL